MGGGGSSECELDAAGGVLASSGIEPIHHCPPQRPPSRAGKGGTLQNPRTRGSGGMFTTSSVSAHTIASARSGERPPMPPITAGRKRGQLVLQLGETAPANRHRPVSNAAATGSARALLP